jgi:putative peptidoglycan lipid II flippase
MFAEPIFGVAVGVFVAGRGAARLPAAVPARHRAAAAAALGLAPPGRAQDRRLMLPAILGSSVAQINLIVDRVIASFLVTGSISWLYYSDRLLEFPLGIFAIALATVILPGLSRRHAEQSMAAFSATLDWALKLVR